MDEFNESDDTDEEQSESTDDEENLKAQEKKGSKEEEDTKSDDSESEDSKSEDTKPDDSGSGDTKPEEETPDESEVTDPESESLGLSEPPEPSESLPLDPSKTPPASDSAEIKIDPGVDANANGEVKTEPADTDSDFLELDKETQQRMEDIEKAEELAEEEAELKEVGIFAVKTSIGHEKMVANWLAMRAHKRKLDVYAILSPPKLRGYLLLECVKNKEALQDLIKGVQHARSVVEGTTSLDEIEHFLTPKPLVSGIEEGDVVEIIAGPFKGEKAKVTQIDESKEEITVELFEAMVSIPVTIRGDHVRILQKERS